MKIFDWVPQIKAILWDVDGTLYKFTPELSRVIDRQFLELFSREKGQKGKRLERLFWQQYGDLGSKTKVLNSVGLDGQLEVMRMETQIQYDKYLTKDRRLPRLFQALKQLRHVVLTNSSRIGAERKLKALGIGTSPFAAVLVTHEAPYLKPEPRLFSWAAKKIGIKPEQILAVGDREQTDILPAREVGMRTALVWGKSREADVSFATVYEVAEIFGREI